MHHYLALKYYILIAVNFDGKTFNRKNHECKNQFDQTSSRIENGRIGQKRIICAINGEGSISSRCKQVFWPLLSYRGSPFSKQKITSEKIMKIKMNLVKPNLNYQHAISGKRENSTPSMAKVNADSSKSTGQHPTPK